MAFDEAMLATVRCQPGLILIRCYSWSEGTITIGLNQRLERALELSRIGSTPLIRRITGGRAVYHDVAELTYAVAVNTALLGQQRWSGSVSRAHRSIAVGLQSFLGKVGKPSELVSKAASRSGLLLTKTSQPCFASAARYELMASGKKVAASAQRQVGPALLQHGSIKLDGNFSHPALGGESGIEGRPQAIEQQRFNSLATTLSEALAAVFEANPTDAASDLVPPKLLHTQLQFVQSDPLGKRDTFEHY